MMWRKGWLLWTLSLVLFLALASVEVGRLRAAAEAPEADPAAPAYTATDDLWLVVDTSETMGPELNALAAAWGGSEAAAVEATYHLLTYTDRISYTGNTAEPGAYQTWLDNLTAGGGGDSCRDNGLRALLNVARHTPTDGFPNSDALLLTDAEPFGGRRALAFTADALARRGVRAHPLITGWCLPFDMPPGALLFLAEATGGIYYTAQAQPMVTVTQMALNQMATTADLGRLVGMTTNEEPFELTFPVDTSMTTLSVDSSGTDPCDGWGLTCVVRLQSAPAYTLTVQLRGPGGMVIGPGHPAMTVLETDHRLQMNVDLGGFSGPPTGTWTLRVSGMGGFRLAVAAQSSLNFDYRGPNVVPAGRPVQVRALILDDTDGAETAQPATAEQLEYVTFHAYGLHGEIGPALPLFDDGEHGDREAGDGLYGGVITLPQGFWRLAAQGELADGTRFQRVDPALIRAHRLRVAGPGDRSAQPGRTLSHAFQVGNDGEMTQTYGLLVSSSMGWAVTDTVPADLTLGPGESAFVQVPVQVPAGAPIGAMEETSLTAVGVGDVSLSNTASVLVTVAETAPVYLPAVREAPPEEG